MTRTVTALFDSYDDAVRAVRSLEAAGIPHSDISILANKGGEPQTVAFGTTEAAAEGAGAGAAVGTALGGGAGLLAGLGLVAIPGLGPLVAAGWLAAMAVGASAGAATGGVIGALTGAGLNDEDAQVYAEGVRRGGTLVSARVEDSQYPAASAILNRHNAVDPAARVKVYRAAGWTRFDSAAEPSAPAEAAPPAPRPDQLIASDRVAGTTVYDPNGKPIGSVRRVMIEKRSGQVAYVVMAFGGIAGIGEDRQTIPWQTLHYDTELQGYRTSVTEEQVRGAPALFGADGEETLARERERALHDHYGARYYWEA
jgi:hypothetical protein